MTERPLAETPKPGRESDGRNHPVQASVHLNVDEPQGRSADPWIDASSWLELGGQLDDPIRQQRDVTLSLYPTTGRRTGSARPASVGAVIQLRPEVGVVARMPHREFDRLWAFAPSGQLTFV